MLRLYVKSVVARRNLIVQVVPVLQKETWWSGPVALDANGNLFILSDEDSNAHAPTHDLLSGRLDYCKLSKGHKSCPLIQRLFFSVRSSALRTTFYWSTKVWQQP
jgi:hypothetical protein